MTSSSPRLTLLFLLPALALTSQPADARDAALEHAVDLFDRQAYDEARREFEGLLEQSGDDAQVSYYLGRLDLIDSDNEGAAKRFEQAIDFGPDQSAYHHWLAIAVMRTMPYTGLLGRMTGSMKALREFRKAIQLDPSNLRARMTLFQMMARSYDRGAASKEDLIQQVASIAEIDSVMGHVARGTFSHRVAKDIERAEVEFETGFDLAPGNRAAALSYADYLWDVGRKDEAIGILAAFLDSMPNDKPACFDLGSRIILSGKDYARAKHLFDECLSLKSETGMPSEAMVRWCLGLAYHLLGEEERAKAEWAAVYALDEDFDRVLSEVPQMSELHSVLVGR